MSLLSRRNKVIYVHSFVWAMYMIYEVAIIGLLSWKLPDFMDTILHFLLNIFLFYANYALINYCSSRRIHLVYIAILTFLLLVGYTALLYILKVVLMQLGVPLSYPITSFYSFAVQGVWRGVYFIGMSYGYWFAMSAFINEKKIRIKQSRHLMLENEITLTELAFLKAQINPHFLFNSLNFLYSQVYSFSIETARSILLLSDIMRYAMQDQDISGKSYLEEEVVHLKNYIAINQLRFHHQLNIHLTITGQLEFRKVPSLILITIIENAFKHGDLTDPDFPCVIQLTVEDDLLNLYVTNKKSDAVKAKPSGIGLANIRKRLNRIYNTNNYLMNVEEDAISYTLTLQIKI